MCRLERSLLSFVADHEEREVDGRWVRVGGCTVRETDKPVADKKEDPAYITA